MECNVARGSKASDGKRIAEPCVAEAMYPSTQPKQWKSGGGQHMVSVGVRWRRAPMRKPLFNIFLCVSTAALGEEVVPEVNWMVAVSSGCRFGRASWAE